MSDEVQIDVKFRAGFWECRVPGTRTRTFSRDRRDALYQARLWAAKPFKRPRLQETPNTWEPQDVHDAQKEQR